MRLGSEVGKCSFFGALRKKGSGMSQEDTPGETLLEAQQGESWLLNLEAGRCTAGKLTSD